MQQRDVAANIQSIAQHRGNGNAKRNVKYHMKRRRSERQNRQQQASYQYSYQYSYEYEYDAWQEAWPRKMEVGTVWWSTPHMDTLKQKTRQCQMPDKEMGETGLREAGTRWFSTPYEDRVASATANKNLHL